MHAEWRKLCLNPSLHRALRSVAPPCRHLTLAYGSEQLPHAGRRCTHANLQSKYLFTVCWKALGLGGDHSTLYTPSIHVQVNLGQLPTRAASTCLLEDREAIGDHVAIEAQYLEILESAASESLGEVGDATVTNAICLKVEHLESRQRARDACTRQHGARDLVGWGGDARKTCAVTRTRYQAR